MKAELLRQMNCVLGEGPVWTGSELAFFDILEGRLHRLSADGAELRTHDIGRFASAMALTARGDWLVATETDLALFDPRTGEQRSLAPLEADNPVTRSNDGRADRQGGFWIGTMGTGAESGAGAFYRYHKGHLRCLRQGITVPNATCFSPDGRIAYFADSALRTVFRWTLDRDGWPEGAPEPFWRAGRGEGVPDGAVVDAEGALWIALWQGFAVQRVLPNGRADARIEVPVSRPTCPAFGPDRTLFITSARQGMTPAEIAAEPLAGSVFRASIGVDGLPEPEVKLP